MKPSARLKLVSQLIDLPLVDSNDRWCGIVDDVEFEGGAGKPLRLKALLVGPGAYRGRLPGWLYWIVTKIAGDRMARVPLAQVKNIGSAVQLKCAAEKLGLHVTEDKVRAWVPSTGAL